MTIILIYVDCCKKKSGDYVGAAEIAYFLEKEKIIEPNCHCVLASSKKGVEKLKELYGNLSSNQLDIHGLKIEVVELEEFAKQKEKPTVKKYIEVATCEPPSPELVRQAITNTTNLLFLGLPVNCPIITKSIQSARYPEEFKADRAQVQVLGFGSSRIGLMLYDEANFAKLDHSAYQSITTQKYGFVYFNGHEENAPEFLFDYLSIAQQLTLKSNNYIFVGEPSIALAAIKEFARKNPLLKFNIFNPKAKIVTTNQTPNSQTQNIWAVHELKQADKLPDNVINCLILSGVCHEQMRCLMNGALPFIAVTGVFSMLEAMAFGKIALYQYLKNNKHFVKSYYEEMKDCQDLDELMWDYYPKEIQAIAKIVKLINDDSWREQVVAKNMALFKKSREQAVVTMRKHLQQKKVSF